MKAVKIILNILGIITAVVLSIVLVAVLFVSPVLSAASNLTQPKTITNVITSIDYEKVLVQEGDLEDSMLEYGIPAESVNELMKSQAVKDVITLYAEDFSAALSGDEIDKSLTPEAIKKVLADNIDEVADIAYSAIKDQAKVEKEEIKTALTTYVDENAENIVSYLPDAKEMFVETVDVQVVETVKLLQNGSIAIAMWVAITLISLAIYGCRFRRFKGFMWLGVVYFIGAVFAITLRILLNTVVLTSIADSLPISADFAIPALNVIFGEVTKIAIILFVISLAFIAAFIVGRVHIKKKTAAALAAEAAVVTDDTSDCPKEAEAVAENIAAIEEAEAIVENPAAIEETEASVKAE